MIFLIIGFIFVLLIAFLPFLLALSSAACGGRSDLPETFGPYTTCYNRFVRWRRAGV